MVKRIGQKDHIRNSTLQRPEKEKLDVRKAKQLIAIVKADGPSQYESLTVKQTEKNSSLKLYEGGSRKLCEWSGLMAVKRRQSNRILRLSGWMAM